MLAIAPRADEPAEAAAARRAVARPRAAATLRFLDYALANGELWSPAGFVLGWTVQLSIAVFAFRLTRARQMVRQYPWLYRRKGLLGWDDRP
jgi:hypothetical protein